VIGDDLALMTAFLAGSLLLAALLGWRGGDSRQDLTLMGGGGLALGAASAVLFAA
jgi:hypothetical protein